MDSIYHKILDAKDHISDVVHKTPLLHSKIFSKLIGANVYLKCEHLQKTGSFKMRGAYNKIRTLTDKEKSKGVIASSAGNHAQGVAHAATLAGISSTIVMPENTPLAKIQATKEYGADIILCGQVFDDACTKAKELQQTTDATFIHAFDDPYIIAGQGTIGLELLEQLPEVDAVLVPIGGGGLISGIGAAIKETHPNVQVIGVEAAGAASMYQSIIQKQRLLLPEVSTIADGIALKEPGDLNYQLAKMVVDDFLLVRDEDIARTMLILLERTKQMVEASGAAALAALLAKENVAIKERLVGKNVVAILSGGNVDVNFISRIIEQGLTEAGRYLRFLVSVPDRPGNLQRIVAVLTEQKVNIISIEHFRVGSRITLGKTEIEFVVETIDFQHGEKIISELIDRGFTPVTL